MYKYYDFVDKNKVLLTLSQKNATKRQGKTRKGGIFYYNQ